ncbi:hypothetical protein [Streptomyces acidicola]|uniref:hypothetical protein n=1 Tax=Streptomyces acidicola TaxID=2596892 RepID=UPI0018839B23|nr:hypothetical protein [Streptomyces acidicola]
MANLFHTLMTDTLGYDKYAAAGSGYGALITSQLGHTYAAHLYGIHLGMDLPLGNFQTDRYWDVTGGHTIPADASPRLREALLNLEGTYASHVAAHMLDAQTITHGLNDSPAGMLVWILQRWKKWSDRWGHFDEVFDRDFILTNATIFWATRTIGSSLRVYRNCNRYPWTPSHDRHPQVQAPAGFSFLLGDAYPPGVRTVEEPIAAFENGPTRHLFNAVHVNAHQKGGHFTAWENQRPSSPASRNRSANSAENAAPCASRCRQCRPDNPLLGTRDGGWSVHVDDRAGRHGRPRLISALVRVTLRAGCGRCRAGQAGWLNGSSIQRGAFALGAPCSCSSRTGGRSGGRGTWPAFALPS